MICSALAYVAWILLAYAMDWHAREDRKSRTTTFYLHGRELRNVGLDLGRSVDRTVVATWTWKEKPNGAELEYNLGRGRIHYLPLSEPFKVHLDGTFVVGITPLPNRP